MLLTDGENIAEVVADQPSHLFQYGTVSVPEGSYGKKLVSNDVVETASIVEGLVALDYIEASGERQLASAGEDCSRGGRHKTPLSLTSYQTLPRYYSHRTH